MTGTPSAGLTSSEFGATIGFPMWTGMFTNNAAVTNEGSVITNVVKLVISADNPMQYVGFFLPKSTPFMHVDGG